MLKYHDVPERTAKRTAWNQPVLWPAWALLAVALVVLAPAVRTVMRRVR